MGWRTMVLEASVYAMRWVTPRTVLPPANPESIFVLRNNDIGDVLVATPLFEALKRRFPWTKISVGVGSWSRDVLIGNPNIDEIMTVNAPWHNHAMADVSAAAAIKYLSASAEIATLASRRFPIGIDVLGSGCGMTLLMRAGIPYRLGVQGYAGGHTGAQKVIHYDSKEHVSRSAIRFAEALGASHLPEPRPQIYLSMKEVQAADERWSTVAPTHKTLRVLVAPGAGRADKAWPSYAALLPRLAAFGGCSFGLTGLTINPQISDAMRTHAFTDWSGKLSLRESIAMAARADWVLTSPSMMMHAAAAFRVPTVVLLGSAFESTQDHARQWGYDGFWWSFGREYGRQVLPSVDEIFSAITHLWREGHASPRRNNHGH
jgi:ADP-heptose:LPS heptosyltransferase